MLSTIAGMRIVATGDDPKRCQTTATSRHATYVQMIDDGLYWKTVSEPKYGKTIALADCTLGVCSMHCLNEADWCETFNLRETADGKCQCHLVNYADVDVSQSAPMQHPGAVNMDKWCKTFNWN